MQIMQLLKSSCPSLPMKAPGYIYTGRWIRPRGKKKEHKKKRKKMRKNSRKDIHNQKSSNLRLSFHYREETSSNHYSVIFGN